MFWSSCAHAVLLQYCSVVLHCSTTVQYPPGRDGLDGSRCPPAHTRPHAVAHAPWGLQPRLGSFVERDGPLMQFGRKRWNPKITKVQTTNTNRKSVKQQNSTVHSGEPEVPQTHGWWTCRHQTVPECPENTTVLLLSGELLWTTSFCWEWRLHGLQVFRNKINVFFYTTKTKRKTTINIWCYLFETKKL